MTIDNNKSIFGDKYVAMEMIMYYRGPFDHDIKMVPRLAPTNNKAIMAIVN